MKILITESGYLPQSADAPEIGKSYNLEPADNHSESQRKAWHAIVHEMYKSGLWSYDTLDFNQFRDFIKKDYGAGFDRFKWVDENYCIHTAKALEEIPDHVLQAQADGQHGRINGVLKSFTRYTKKQVKESLDKLINSCFEHGLSSRKFQEIMEGLNEMR